MLKLSAEILFKCFDVKFQSLIQFVNKHLNKINLEVTDLDSQVNV